MNSTDTYTIELDGLAIEFEFQSAEIGDLLHFLFKDIHSKTESLPLVAGYIIDRDEDNWRLRQRDSAFSMRHADPIEFAMTLLNHIMRHFSKQNKDSITLHSALVSDKEGSILMPGTPGSGKSMVSLWLTHLGLNYHTDEMVTINRDNHTLSALTRPFTLRHAGMEVFTEHADMNTKALLKQGEIQVSTLNAWIAHRAINPHYCHDIPPLKAILFPVFTTGDRCQITEISRAHAGMELMRAHFQSQRLEDHGFVAISALVRDTPAYLLVYNEFRQLNTLMAELIHLP